MQNRSKFTDLSIPKLSEGMHWDLMLPAFGCRVGKTRRTFICVQNGGNRTTLGHYPALSLAQARDKARILMSGPSARPGAFCDVLEAYIAQHLKPNCSARHAKDTEWLLRRHFNFTGSINSITKHQVVQTIDQIDHRSLANHATVAIKMLMNWAHERDYIQLNPIAKLSKPYRTSSRDKLITDDELRRIWQHATGPFGVILKCLILSGQRRGQFAPFNQSYIQADTIVWPPEAMKGREQHAIPLTARLRSYTAQLPESWNSWSKPMNQLRKNANVSDVTIHDFRRYVSSTMRQLNVPIDVTEALLAHKTGSRSQIQRIYDRYDRMPELRNALQLYESELEKRGVID